MNNNTQPLSKKEKIRIREKLYRERNKERLALARKEYDKLWSKRNRKRRREIESNYLKNASKQVLFVFRTRGRIREVIKNSFANKTQSTNDLIGCTGLDACNHIENLFTEGMSWENYGEWHIDHIRPCASFNLQDPEEQKKCFHYTNLQPLWGKDNDSKNSWYKGVRHFYKK